MTDMSLLGSWVLSDSILGANFFVLLFLRAADVWGLGCLVWEAFNGHLDQSMSLRNTSKVSICCSFYGFPKTMLQGPIYR